MKALKMFLTLITVLTLGLLTVLFVTKSAIRASSGKYIVGYSSSEGAMIFNRYPTYPLVGNVGPFVLKDTIVRVIDGQLTKRPVTTQSMQIVSTNKGSVGFRVSPTYYEISVPATDELRDSTFVVSDVQGNFTALVTLLQAHKVIDEALNWSFGTNELITIGDFVEGGEEIEQVLWLLRKLEVEAGQASGRLSFVLGDREVMSLQGDWSNVNERIKALSTALEPEVPNQVAYRKFYDQRTFFGQWLLSKPVMIRRGKYLFVHGGLHPDLANKGLKLEEINREVSTALSLPFESHLGRTATWLLSANGPLNYRGLVQSAAVSEPIENRQLTRVLHAFEAERVVIGHTLVNEVSTDYSGRVLRVKVEHDQTKASAKTQGALIVGEVTFKADASGGVTRL